MEGGLTPRGTNIPIELTRAVGSWFRVSAAFIVPVTWCSGHVQVRDRLGRRVEERERGMMHAQLPARR